MTGVTSRLPEPALAASAAHPPDGPAVVTVRSPLRISLAGGGTDLPSYSSRYGGLVVGCAIDRYVGVTLFPRDFRGRLRTAVDTTVECDRAGNHPHPMVRACLLRAGVDDGCQLVSFSDAPSGSGLGGSAAFAVSVLHAAAPGASARTLAETAAAVEIDDLGRAVGKQDHYLAAYGGIRLLRFHPSGRVDPQPLELPAAVRAGLEARLLLFYSGTSRDAGAVLAEQNERTRSGNDDALRRLHAIRSIADEMVSALERRDLGAIGHLVNEHWSLKSGLGSRISSPRLQALHDRAREAGASGAKLLGSGGGGFLLLVCQPERHAEVRRSMVAAGLRELPFRLAEGGSRAIRMPL
ncbi:hypothetical protein ACH4VS_39600 [Streptomyces hygroscopicus]|uniref:Putative heptose-(7-phosphate)-1-phosphotransferase n=1 Tax=Streptomyces hygroscopicus subsp. hygroscopicus TaxID=68042 RepID=Q2MFR6_STRHY|nr:hypothetical protein [Streptomyces hygroscopicus]GLV79958.1 GHMP kinase [Streptomyces hygroscopicus subsp. hygroscopicus]CAF31851.1 putative heptose-(7-phosphate)-1-phosphotransferase [Streptomyces hygroscopicus subsp. hygroscopicus]